MHHKKLPNAWNQMKWRIFGSALHEKLKIHEPTEDCKKRVENENILKKSIKESTHKIWSISDIYINCKTWIAHF